MRGVDPPSRSPCQADGGWNPVRRRRWLVGANDGNHPARRSGRAGRHVGVPVWRRSVPRPVRGLGWLDQSGTGAVPRRRRRQEHGATTSKIPGMAIRKTGADCAADLPPSSGHRAVRTPPPGGAQQRGTKGSVLAERGHRCLARPVVQNGRRASFPPSGRSAPQRAERPSVRRWTWAARCRGYPCVRRGERRRRPGSRRRGPNDRAR